MWFEIGIETKAGIILKFRPAVSADGAESKRLLACLLK